MTTLLVALDRLGGLGRRSELRAWGVSDELIDLTAFYSHYGGSMKGNHVLRVRKGWYARRSEHPDVLRAWRVGGRLTCVSALAYHEGTAAPPVLHVEVAANANLLRHPDREGERLGPDAPVVVHWARYPGEGDRRAVTAEHAEAMAAACGVHSGPVTRHSTQAAARVSASRIV